MGLAAQPNDEVVLEMPDAGLRLDTWTSYSFNSNFLSPTDEWHFTIAHEQIPEPILAAISNGARVTLSVGGHIQGNGYIDEVQLHHSREGGHEITVTGRDMLAPMVDSNMDPRQRFPETQTMAQFVAAVAGPYGFGSDAAIVDSNKQNQGVLTGETRGIKTSRKGKPLRSIILHRLKPYPNESAFNFMARITQRHGLWPWASADGTQLIVSTPTFDQAALYTLARKLTGGRNNIESGGARLSLRSQPSIIVAQGFGGGYEFPNTRHTVLMINPAVDADSGAIRAAYPDATQIPLSLDGVSPLKSKTARPMFLYDEESKTPEQLQNFVRREMALKMRQSFTAQYVVDGHTQNGTPWAVDTMVHVDDDRGRVHEELYVLARTFTKDRRSGTKTHLELIRPGTLVFS